MSGGAWGKLIRGSLTAVLGLAILFAAAPAVEASGFTEPERVSQKAFLHIGSEQGDVVANPDGSFTYAWVQGLTYQSRYLATTVVEPDGSVGTINVIESASDTPPFVSEGFDGIDLSAGSDGGVHLTWAKRVYDCDPSCTPDIALRYANLDATGDPIGSPATVRTLDTGIFIVGPKVATSGTGRTGILWAEYDGLTTTTVMMALAQDDAAPLAPFEIAGDNWLGVQELSIAGSSNGTLFPAWSGYHTDYGSIKANGRLVTDDGTITDEREIGVAASGFSEIQTLIDGTGRATFIARDSASNLDLGFRQLDPAGALLGSGMTKLSLAENTDADPGLPYAGLAPDGTITVAFAQAVPPEIQPGIWTRTISPTGALGTPTNFVPASPDIDLDDPTVAVGPDGSGFITWNEVPETPPGDASYFYKGRPMSSTGAPTGSTQLLQTLGRSPSEYPEARSVAFSADNNGASLWSVNYSDLDSVTELFTSVFDASAPEAQLWIPPVVTTDQEVVLAAVASDNSELSYAWKVNGETLAATGPVIRHTFASEGQSNVEVTVTDAHSNETTVSGNLTVNSPPVPPEPPVPPNTLIKGKPAKSTKAKAATFKFISSLTGSQFECRLDKAGWSSCKSPKKLKKLKPGKHTFRVRAIKGDLIDKTPASYSWTVKKPKKKK